MIELIKDLPAATLVASISISARDSSRVNAHQPPLPRTLESDKL